MTYSKSIFSEGLKYVGLSEVPGFESNELILSWVQRYYPNITDDSKVAWCSIFLLVLFQELGLDVTGVNPAAKSWGNLVNSKEVSLLEAQKNDIVIFHRTTPDSWKGHVGVLGSLNVEGDIVLLSGNHRNKVTVEAWKTDKLHKIIRPNFNQFV